MVVAAVVVVAATGVLISCCSVLLSFDIISRCWLPAPLLAFSVVVRASSGPIALLLCVGRCLFSYGNCDVFRLE